MAADSILLRARAQLSAYDRVEPIAPPSAEDPAFDLKQGYAVLAQVQEERRRRGERPVGRKIGFTNRNIWPQYGVDSPIWAPVYDTTLVTHRAEEITYSLARTRSPRLEPEIAFGLRNGVAAGQREPERILESVEWVAPAFEVVDCLYPDWRFRVQDTVAQQGLHAALILGPRVALPPGRIGEWSARLRDCRATLACDGQIVERGTGSNALGHPALAVAFLADVLAEQPQFEPLTAGEVVTTGTLTAALPVAPAETWRFELDGIGLAPLSVRFS